MENRVSRRRVLRTAGTSLGAAGVAGLAGCTSSLLGDDADGAELTAWLVDPPVEDDDVFTRSFEFATPPVVFDHDDRISDPRLDTSAELRDQIGVSATELDWTLGQSGTARVTVVAGSIPVEDVGADLSDWADERGLPLTADGDHRGFELYQLGERNEGFAVRDDYVVSASPPGFEDPVAVVEAVLDGRFDGSHRWSDDADAEALFDAMPDGQFADGSIRDAPVDDDDVSDVPDWEVGLLGDARVLSIDGETTDVTAVFLYDSAADADADDVEAYADEQRDAAGEFATLRDDEVTVEDRAVVLTGTVETSATF